MSENGNAENRRIKVEGLLFNALRRERQRYPASFKHLVFKRRPTHIKIINGKNLANNLEEIFK